MSKFGLPAALILLAAAILAGCGSGNESHVNVSTRTAKATAVSAEAAKATAVSTEAAKAAATGNRLSDCNYATALVKSLGTFTTSLPDPTTFTTADDAIKSYNTFGDQLTSLISQLQSYQLSPDVAKVNSDAISIFADTKGQIAELTSAAQAGDTAKLTDVSTTITQDILPRLNTVQQQNKATVDRLNKCVKG